MAQPAGNFEHSERRRCKQTLTNAVSKTERCLFWDVDVCLNQKLGRNGWIPG